MDADLRQVSVLIHRNGLAIWNGIAIEETTATIAGEGIGHFGNGYYDTELMAAFGQSRREWADEFPPTMKLVAALGEYLAEEYHGRYYPKARTFRGTSRPPTTRRSRMLTSSQCRRHLRRPTNTWRTPHGSKSSIGR